MSAEVDAAVDTSLPAAAIDNAADAAPEPERSEAVNEEASKRREQEEALSAMKRWKLWAEAKRLWNAESASKAIDFLQEHELVEPTAVGVARMLRLKAGRGGFDKQVLGEYLSKKKPFNEEVRRAFSETFDFTGMTFVEALREYLTTFRLPGESMLIERLFATFAARFYRNNPGDFCPAQLTEEKIEQLGTAFESFAGGKIIEGDDEEENENENEETEGRARSLTSTMLPPNWKKYSAENGELIYVNIMTGVTQFEFPAEHIVAPPLPPPDSAGGGELDFGGNGGEVDFGGGAGEVDFGAEISFGGIDFDATLAAPKATIARSGHMTKQGGVRKNWQRRWFELHKSEFGDTLLYFDGEGGKQKGSIDLTKCQAVSNTHKCRLYIV